MTRKLLSLLLLVTHLTACAPKETPITGAERDAVLAYSEPQTDNLLAALNSGDYTAFSRDFDADMLAAMPPINSPRSKKIAMKNSARTSRAQ